MVAGTPSVPFGSQGGHLVIGLWGAESDSVHPIACQGNGQQCYNPARVGMYCQKGMTSFSPTDPCQVIPPATQTKKSNANQFFEGYSSDDTHHTTIQKNSGDFGRKVLAVSYGGSLQLFGNKGAFYSGPSSLTSCPIPSAPYKNTNIQNWANLSQTSWARLNSNAAQFSKSITLDRPVNWSPGDTIIVGATDWHVGHSEVAIVQNISNETLTLTGNLGFNHNGTAYQVPANLTSPTTNPNTAVENRGVVGLLSRSITIQSLGATATDSFPLASDCTLSDQVSSQNKDCYYGGHLVVRQGFARAQIQGVEFHHMGQGGILGAYPIHFHLAKDTSYTNAFVRDSSIWESNTRFITLHGTHEVELSRNVGYLSMGHGFYLEDGSEINNLLCNNLGVSARGAFLNYFNAQEQIGGPTSRYVPPILTTVNGGDYQGSDASYPTMYWMMNAWNEFVGNQAVGTGGFGVCYWPLDSSVSGPSANGMTWASNTNSDRDYAKFNHQGQLQAPLKRFRGNGCSTSAYAFMTERQSLTPNSNFLNITDPTTSPTPAQVSSNPYIGIPTPTLGSNFYPIKYGTQNDVCAPQEVEGTPSNNSNSCVASVIDRFTTSFNWAQINFAAIWLRPWSWVVINSAVTDQLFGGLGFVSGGGSWDQGLNRQMAIIKDSIFVGSVNPQDPEAGAQGPDLSLLIPKNDKDCIAGSHCLLANDGTGLPIGALNPKRMLTIYDGPFFSDGNIFASINEGQYAVGGDGKGCAAYTATNFSNIYDTTEQIAANYDPTCKSVSSYKVPNAAVGWKQTNFFYYPPAFSFKGTSFATDGSLRHNVLDQNLSYTSGLSVPPGNLGRYTVKDLQATPIDVTTILNDMDGSLNGLVPVAVPPNQKQLNNTQSVGLSNNPFYDVPYSIAQCDSVGTTTEPNAHVSTVIASLDSSTPTKTYGQIENTFGSQTPAVAVYRQLLTGSSGEQCTTNTNVCTPGGTNCCRRGTFFMGAYIGQAPGLTMNKGIYYIDTDTPIQTAGAGISLASFTAGNTYGVYNLYANSKTSVQYQFYVGTGQALSSLAFNWIRVFPHVSIASSSAGSLKVSVDTSDNAATTQIIPSLSIPSQTNPYYDSVSGMLYVTLSHAGYKGFYQNTISQKQANSNYDSEVCYPRNLCTMSTNNQCVRSSTFTESGLKTQINEVCQYWATRTTQEMEDTLATTNSAGTVYLNDCPTGGCLGFSFTLPSGFTPRPYKGAIGTSNFTSSQFTTTLSALNGSTCPIPPATGNFPSQ